MDPYTWLKTTAVEKKYVDQPTVDYYMTCSSESTVAYEHKFDECLETISQLEATLLSYNATSTKSKVQSITFIIVIVYG